MDRNDHTQNSGWPNKFSLAFRGLWLGGRGQRSFWVHIPLAVVVLALAALLRCELWQWSVLLLCITMVISAELMNSAVEELAKAIDLNHNPTIGRALDIASGAVLSAAIGAAVVGALVLGGQGLQWLP